MRVIGYRRQGPAREVLEALDLPPPVPVPGEALVRLMASGVNPADCNRRAGRGHAMDGALIVPHSDGAGVVEAVGQDADRHWIGQRVWLYNAQRGRAMGTAAEQVCLDVSLLSGLPQHVAFEHGACLGIPCMTAWCSLFGDGELKGQTVLVTGGAGAVSHYAIQLAAHAGARVLSTASTPLKAREALEAGAIAVADYQSPYCAKQLLDGAGGAPITRIVDVDFGRNLPTTLAVAADNATVVAYASRGDEHPRLPFYDLLRRNLRLHAVYLAGLPLPLRQAAQAGIGQWLRSAAAQHRVPASFPLAQTVLAHEAVERGDKRGTVVVLPQA
ncbi:MAG: NADPH:quinone reductase [Betaproteobacteria bacterium]